MCTNKVKINRLLDAKGIKLSGIYTGKRHQGKTSPATYFYLFFLHSIFYVFFHPNLPCSLTKKATHNELTIYGVHFCFIHISCYQVSHGV